jgi:hypothetical protein
MQQPGTEGASPASSAKRKPGWDAGMHFGGDRESNAKGRRREAPALSVTAIDS